MGSGNKQAFSHEKPAATYSKTFKIRHPNAQASPEKATD